MRGFLQNLPSTNFRILVTMVLAALVIVVVGVCLLMQKDLPLDVLIATYAFLAAMAGVDYLQYGKKRDTYIPSPPAAVDVEDAAAVPNPHKEV